MDMYLTLKTLHLIAIITWFAGLFYLPRLFVYHVDAPTQAHNMLCTMEQKLYRYIMRPSMLVVWGAGLGLLINYPPAGGWIHAKILLVFLLTGYHHILGAYVKKFAAGTNTKTGKFFRIMNEIPSVFLVLIIILAVFKPF